MKQGDIWLADLNPVRGSEQRGQRPVVIISGNAMNDNLGISIICPLSSKIKHYAGCVIIYPDGENCIDKESEIITFQVRTISQSRMVRKVGVITDKQLEAVKKGLNEILKY
jgi:mRNA interferase MazF